MSDRIRVYNVTNTFRQLRELRDSLCESSLEHDENAIYVVDGDQYVVASNGYSSPSVKRVNVNGAGIPWQEFIDLAICATSVSQLQNPIEL